MKLHLEVTVTADYTCSEFDVQALKANLRDSIQSLYDEGSLTDDTDAECDGFAVSQTSSILTDKEDVDHV